MLSLPEWKVAKGIGISLVYRHNGDENGLLEPMATFGFYEEFDSDDDGVIEEAQFIEIPQPRGWSTFPTHKGDAVTIVYQRRGDNLEIKEVSWDPGESPPYWNPKLMRLIGEETQTSK